MMMKRRGRELLSWGFVQFSTGNIKIQLKIKLAGATRPHLDLCHSHWRGARGWIVARREKVRDHSPFFVRINICM